MFYFLPPLKGETSEVKEFDVVFLLISLSGADWWGPGWEVTEDGGTGKRAWRVPECVCLWDRASSVAGFDVHLLHAEALSG